MNTHTLTKVGIGLTLGSTLVLAGCADTDDRSPGGMDRDGMSQGMLDADAPANQADVMFAQMMIPHHEQALVMSRIVLDKDGVDPAVVDLATRIENAQEPEIATMEGFLDEWGVPQMGDHSGHEMDGMLSDEEIQALEAADAATVSRLFLEGMIAHHEGAVDMAEAELADGENAEALALAQEIIDAQEAEIKEMQELLAAL
ncbi:DUF305 domain-containing protein [Oerskovia turbata]|uniref:DUF305 domain-containing protein n=1 Tax=Oerskovia turbata TaxID=1713 RepID=A0A4Q1KXW9_9CELL|nr:DUF305 domain-containing protein [Oerskovia turbata]RXR25065.1 DUF305 domain-containing protein [Oerskovia turbata]RXR35211.1 DUF305 domain-containing protein [Oerskovia turbata]TGJ96448.1 DUF305 domain-containing protein [Actinotalea fermentans ATCC 43279 = JCM 9966 = DSM 3133]